METEQDMQQYKHTFLHKKKTDSIKQLQSVPF